MPSKPTDALSDTRASVDGEGISEATKVAGNGSNGSDQRGEVGPITDPSQDHAANGADHPTLPEIRWQ
jgi:hypothetical protein